MKYSSFYSDPKYLYAGDNGFQVNVNGNTDLKGAVMASTDQAIQDNKNSLTTNTLTTSNIENKAEYGGKASSLGAEVGTTKQPDGMYRNAPTASAGFGKESDKASSTTVSAVSGAAVAITDNAKQQTTTGKDVATTVATLNRDVKVNEQGNAVDSQGNATAGTLKEKSMGSDSIDLCVSPPLAQAAKVILPWLVVS